MITLLDANFLIALMVEDHPHHHAALRFFPEAQATGWATCAIIENALLRIVGSPAFPGGPGSPQAIRKHFLAYLASPGHQFWTDDLSLCDPTYFPELPAAKHLTDIYLLGLAVKRGGRFATFDAKIDASVLPGGIGAYYMIPT